MSSTTSIAEHSPQQLESWVKYLKSVPSAVYTNNEHYSDEHGIHCLIREYFKAWLSVNYYMEQVEGKDRLCTRISSENLAVTAKAPDKGPDYIIQMQEHPKEGVPGKFIFIGFMRTLYHLEDPAKKKAIISQFQPQIGDDGFAILSRDWQNCMYLVCSQWAGFWSVAWTVSSRYEGLGSHSS